MFKTLCFALMATFATGATAQTSARPDPADPRAAAPSRPYESAFKDYRRYSDTEVARWRQSNEDMGRLGGHVGHVRPEAGGTGKAGDKAPAAGHGARK